MELCLLCIFDSNQEVIKGNLSDLALRPLRKFIHEFGDEHEHEEERSES